ncbi:hypothetical protein ACTSFT_003694 [Vibrio parahaemolyticus]
MKLKFVLSMMVAASIVGCATYKENQYQVYDTDYSGKSVYLWVQTKSPFEHPITDERYGFDLADKYCREWGFANGIKLPTHTVTANQWGGADYVFKYQCSNSERVIKEGVVVHKPTGTEPYHK